MLYMISSFSRVNRRFFTNELDDVAWPPR